MKLKPYYLYSLLLLIPALILSCSKDEASGPEPDTRTKKELIMLSTWKLTAITSDTPVDTDGKDGASTDVFIQTPTCETDDTYKMNKDSTVSCTNNTKCSSREPATYKQSWIMSPDEKTLNWNSIVYDIIELNATQMKLYYTITKGSETYKLTNTYNH